MSAPPVPTSCRLLHPALFVGSMAAVWLLRWGFAPVAGPVVTRAEGKAAGASPPVIVQSGGGSSLDPRELGSVTSGLVL